MRKKQKKNKSKIGSSFLATIKINSIYFALYDFLDLSFSFFLSPDHFQEKQSNCKKIDW